MPTYVEEALPMWSLAMLLSLVVPLTPQIGWEFMSLE
jgi:hypothetical protein